MYFSCVKNFSIKMQFKWKYGTEDMIQRLYTFYSTFSQSRMNDIYMRLKSPNEENNEDNKKTSARLFQKFTNVNINIVNIIYVIDSIPDNDLYSIIRNFFIHLSKYTIVDEHEIQEIQDKLYNIQPNEGQCEDKKINREELLYVLHSIIGNSELRLFLFVHQLYSSI